MAGPALILPDGGSRPALWTGAGNDAGWLSHAALAEAVAALAATLAAAAPGLLMLFAARTPGAVLAAVAALSSGRPLLLANPELPAAARGRLVDLYRPALIAGPPEVVAASGLDAFPAPPLADLPRADLALAARPDPAPCHPDLALLLATSGSTGGGRFVRLPAPAVAANLAQVRQVLGLGTASRALAHLPLHYSYGLSVVLSHLSAGGAVVPLAGAMTEPAFWQVARETACTSFPGVPWHYSLLARLGLARLQVPALNDFTQAGGAAAPGDLARLHAEIAARGGRLFVMYGQTEAGPRITTLPAADFAAKPGAVGPALPGGTLRIDAPGPDGVGEVIYEGPNVMWGYAESAADLARGDDLGGVLRTGDRGRLDGDGCLYLSGRAAREAKVFGERVGLDDLERLAAGLGLPALAVAGAPDRVVVFVEQPAGSDLAAARAALLAASSLPGPGLVMRALPALPRLPSGKPDYCALTALAADGGEAAG